jgi:hypothetical protein
LFFAIALLVQQPTSAPGFRLGFVRKIFVEDLGPDQAAKYVRDQLTGALLNRTRISVETDRVLGDAILKGTAVVGNGYREWAVGSVSGYGAAVAVSSPEGSGAAAAVATEKQFSAGGGTVRIIELGLQLVDSDGRVLWAYDATRCADTAALVLLGTSRNKPTTVCAVEQLVKAIDRDAKFMRR